MSSTENMSFRRFGRSYHLKINTSADLQRVVELDEAHWVATSAPISTINCDSTFLNLLDTDNNGRIRCYEVKDGICWLLRVLRDHCGIDQGRKTLTLQAINCEAREGQQIYNATFKMLGKLGRSETEQITLDEVRQIRMQVESMPVSEAGVVLPEAGQDPEIRQFISDVIGTIGGIPHPSAVEGIDQAKLEEFLSQASVFCQWHQQGQIPAEATKTDIMPLGADTRVAYQILAFVADKIDQYFAQCKLLILEDRFAERMGLTEDEIQNLDLDEPAVIADVLKQSRLAKPHGSGVLRFDDQINPYYVKTLEQFRLKVMAPVLGESGNVMTPEQWQQVKSFFGAHEAWVRAKAGAVLESLGVEKLQAYLEERFNKAVGALIAKSSETAIILDNIRLVEKLLLYQTHMIDLANNFVSFPHLYDPNRRAMFEMGSLVMDGRRFNLAVKAFNRVEHRKIAKTSNMYVLYLEVTAKDGSEKCEVVVPVASGGRGNLCLGKRGVFYDIKGKEADARVVNIIENPISLREALVSPFQRLGRLLTGKIESITGEAEKKFDTQAATAMSQASTAAPSSTPAAKSGSTASTGGMLLGAGVAVAALGSALAYISNKLAEKPLAILVGVVIAILAVLLPISVVAYLKLRNRELSAILEGSGWAINARMRLTRKQGRFFTERPRYPKGSKGVNCLPWRLLLVIFLVLGILVGGGYFLSRALRKGPQQPITQPASEQLLPGTIEAPSTN